MPGFVLKANTMLMICMLSGMGVMAQSGTQYTAIRNTNIQIRGSLHNTPLAWATDTVTIILNKQTGNFEAKLLVDHLRFAAANPDFNGATGENKGKYLTLSGTIPVNDVLANKNNAIDRKVQITANFNDIDYQTTFSFTILALQTMGFSVMANGTISRSALQITNLDQLDDDLVVILSFTGY